jgi:flagellar biosynthesis/type III secretory pathway M-ring protein FliF/YscJ
VILAGTTPDAATVTPGIGGFLTFFVLAVVVVLLVLNMSKHLRRIDARAAEDEAREATEREARSETETETGAGATTAAETGSAPADDVGERDR